MLRALGAFLGEATVAVSVWFSTTRSHRRADIWVPWARPASSCSASPFSRLGGTGEADLLGLHRSEAGEPETGPGDASETCNAPAARESAPAWAELQWGLTGALWAVRAGEAELASKDLAAIVAPSLEAAVHDLRTRDHLTDAAPSLRGARRSIVLNDFEDFCRGPCRDSSRRARRGGAAGDARRTAPFLAPVDSRRKSGSGGRAMAGSGSPATRRVGSKSICWTAGTRRCSTIGKTGSSRRS